LNKSIRSWLTARQSNCPLRLFNDKAGISLNARRQLGRPAIPTCLKARSRGNCSVSIWDGFNASHAVRPRSAIEAATAEPALRDRNEAGPLSARPPPAVGSGAAQSNRQPGVFQGVRIVRDIKPAYSILRTRCERLKLCDKRTLWLTACAPTVALVDPYGRPASAWIDAPGRIRATWQDWAMYSPDGFTIQFAGGAVWVLLEPMPVPGTVW